MNLFATIVILIVTELGYSKVLVIGSDNDVLSVKVAENIHAKLDKDGIRFRKDNEEAIALACGRR